MRRRRGALARALAACAMLLPANASAEDWFEITELPVRGRTVAANFADLDGDGRQDVFSVVFRGLPPDEQREIHLRFQRADGGFGLAADAIVALPPDAAAHDFGPLVPGGESELIFLRNDRLSRLSLRGRKALWRDVALGGPTLAITPDERGLDRLTLLRQEFAPGPLFTVPGLGEIVLVRPSGAIVARLAAPGRANYFIPPRPGPLLGENELEVYLDHPRISVGDVDGDGLADLVASQRHAIRVFRQRAGGEFATQPSRTIPLERISRSDHIRGSGSVRVAVADLDRDGRADLLITHTAEGMLDARSETTLHYNRDGEWNLAQPDQRFTTQGSVSTEELRDLDGDGRMELLTIRIPLGALELAEILITRSLDAHVSVRRAGEGGLPFEPEPSYTRKLSVGFSFETLRSRGFLGNAAGDWNGDGLRDLVLAGDGEAVEIHLGEPGARFASRAQRQSLDTNGRVGLGDFDADGLTDFLIFESRRPDAPVRIGRNLGRLPGTPRPQTLQPAPED